MKYIVILKYAQIEKIFRVSNMVLWNKAGIFQPLRWLCTIDSKRLSFQKLLIDVEEYENSRFI